MNLLKINEQTKELFKNNFNLPCDLEKEIASFLPIRNKIAIQAINEYYDYLYYKTRLYEDFILNNYVKPKCNCEFAPENGNNKIFYRRSCSICFEAFETDKYELDEFKICILENPQFNKIRNDFTLLEI